MLSDCSLEPRKGNRLSWRRKIVTGPGGGEHCRHGGRVDAFAVLAAVEARSGQTGDLEAVLATAERRAPRQSLLHITVPPKY